MITFFFVLFSCEDPNYPENIWDEEDQGKSTPLVTEIQPSEGGFAGFDTIMMRTELCVCEGEPTISQDTSHHHRNIQVRCVFLCPEIW